MDLPEAIYLDPKYVEVYAYHFYVGYLYGTWLLTRGDGSLFQQI
jgi:hypothetical protein